jgi:UV DNA damage endonuclease
LLNVPFTYDVHHHRLNPDGISVDEATRLAVRTWEARGMEPYFHIASGRDHSRAHAEVIDANDVPRCWLSLNQPVTVIVESKGREQAVFRLRNDMAAHPWRRHADRENECDARTGVLADGKQEKESDHETD